MESLPVYLFKDSLSPFLSLLNAHDLKYTMREKRFATLVAAAEVIEVLLLPYMWGALSTIIIAFLKYRNNRKVIITTIDGDIIHAEGLNHEELERLLKRAKSLAVIETRSDES